MKRGCLTALVVLAAIVIGGGVAFWYTVMRPTIYNYRYRMTVNVETPQGVRSGMSVINIRVYVPSRTLSSITPSHHEVHGEAVFVDLGNGKQVIALLAGGPDGSYVDYPSSIVYTAFGFNGNSPDIMRSMERSTESKTLSLENYPTFVTFTDLNDPMSARVVYAIGRRVEYEYQSNSRQAHDRGHMIAVDDMAAAFGPGTRLRDVTVEMTKDDVTRGIEKKLPVMMGKLRELDKTLQLTYPNAPLRVRSGHLSIE